MALAEVFHFHGSSMPLAVVRAGSCVAGTFQSEPAGAEPPREAADLELSERLLAGPEWRLVLDLRAWHDGDEGAVAALATLIQEANRAGKEVCLVRCPEALFTRLEAAGAGGRVLHAGSMAAATDGALADAEGTLTLCLRSMPEQLRRIRAVLSGMADRLQLPEEELDQVKTALGEACTNAIMHGSPRGPRNHVTVSFHLCPEALVIDVADEGPGFNPSEVPAPQAEALLEHGYGIFLMRQLMDRLEYFRAAEGTVVRLTKLRAPAAAP